MDAIVFAVKGGVSFILFFGMVIALAVSNGILSSIAMETDRAKEGRIMGSWQSGYVIREYKRLNPGGGIHLKA